MGGVYGGKDLRKRYLLSLEWKRVGVMDNDSGDDGTIRLRRVRKRMIRIRLRQEVYSKKARRCITK